MSSLYNVRNAQDVVDYLKNIVKENEALVNVIHETQQIGIATRGVPGYTPTNLRIEGVVKYDEVGEIVDEANRLLFPNREPKENWLIVASTMRHGTE